MALIYKITNDVNGKVYIGKTIRTLVDRWIEHLNDRFEEHKTSIPLYNAMNKYGIEHFHIEAVEDGIPNEQINEKERYYIKEFNSRSHDSGYNVTEGGDGGRTSSKLTESEVEEIVNILTDCNNIESMASIGKRFNVAGSTIVSINNGTTWYNDNLSYPLREYDATGLTIPKNIYSCIVEDLKQDTLSLTEIAKKYKLFETKLAAINLGQNCYNGQHKYYREIYSGPFPIRRAKNLKIDIKQDKFVDILHDIIFTKDSMASIGKRYDEKGNTLTYIALGKRRKELTEKFITPLRDNREENQRIFNSLYPNYRKE